MNGRRQFPCWMVVFYALAAVNVSMVAHGAAVQLSQPSPPIGESLQKDAVHAIRIGVQWLEEGQQENGCWSTPVFPAVTALAVSAILKSPDVIQGDEQPLSVSKGLEFIAHRVQENGCIFQPVEGVKGGGLPNYKTAICLMALAAADDPNYESMIASARKCLMDSQYLGTGFFSRWHGIRCHQRTAIRGSIQHALGPGRIAPN